MEFKMQMKEASKAHKETGTEIFVFTVLMLFLVGVLTPGLFVIYSFFQLLAIHEYQRAFMIFSSGLIAATNIYFVGRYNPTLVGHLSRMIYGWITPLLVVGALTTPIFPDAGTVGMSDVFLHPFHSLYLCLVPFQKFLVMSVADKLALIGSSSRALLILCMVVTKGVVMVYRSMCKYKPTTNAQGTGNRKLRVLLAGDAIPPKVDGVATFSIHAIQKLQSFGHTVSVLTSIQGPDELYGAKILRLPGNITKKSKNHSVSIPTPMILYYFYLVKPDVVHCFEVGLMNLLMMFYCHLADIPCTFSHHTRIDLYVNLISPFMPLWFNKATLFMLERGFFPLGDIHLGVCNNLVSKVEHRLGPLAKVGGEDATVRFWSSGVDEKFEAQQNERTDELRHIFSEGRPDLPLVLHVGRLGAEKNSEDIPAIIAETKKLMGEDNVRFAIVGDGLLREQIEKEIKGQAHFAGFIQGTKLIESYCSADVFFSPSTTEAFPLVYLEAMRCGLAVCGPNAGGVPDAFENGVQGCLFEPHDAAQAAQAIKKAIEGGKAMRDKAYSHALAFTWNRSIRELEAAMITAVEKKDATTVGRLLSGSRSKSH